MRAEGGTLVAIQPADRPEPVYLRARLVECPGVAFPVVEYQHADLGDDPSLPLLLCFAGGGCSGAVFAVLAEACLEVGIRVVAFDMPGHTPAGLLGAATPSRLLISRAGGQARRAVSDAILARWRSGGPHLTVLSHSAGAVDVARIRPRLRYPIARFVICGAGTPGVRALLLANRANGSARSPHDPSLSDLVVRRLIPTGALATHYGPESARSTSDADLARYHCAEHVGVALSLLSARAVTRHDWRDCRVTLVGSVGDRICPPVRIQHAEQRLRARGAIVSTDIIESPFPHMFITFQQPALHIARLAADQ